MNLCPHRCSFGGHQSKVLITRLLCFGALAEAGPDASSNVCFFLSPFVSQAKYPKISSFMREGKIQEAFLLRLEALAPLECSSESTTPRPSRAPCLAAPQKCHRRRKRDATSSDLGSFLLRGKQAYAGLQITPFSDFVFSSSQPFRMLGQGEDTGRLHIGNKLCWDAKPT